MLYYFTKGKNVVRRGGNKRQKEKKRKVKTHLKYTRFVQCMEKVQ